MVWKLIKSKSMLDVVIDPVDDFINSPVPWMLIIGAAILALIAITAVLILTNRKK